MLRNNQKNLCGRERGAALLVVLFLVMVATILSLSFLSRSDVELACGENMVLREQMDYLAESGLEHAKGLLLNPQDVSSEYWTGASGQQLYSGQDYYDVNVTMHDTNDLDPTYRCTYNVQCEAYRLKNGEKVGRSAIEAELRLDPSIAYRTETGMSIPSRMIIKGDTYCNGSILNMGTIYGDVFTSPALAVSGSGTVSGRMKVIADANTTVPWPNVNVGDFTSKYPCQSLPSTVSGVTYGPYTPPKVCYCNGTLKLQGAVTIEGMLVVQGDLQVSGVGNIINAGKNLPALYVTGTLIIEDGAELTINGLAVVDNRVKIRASIGNFNVYGGLFVKNGLFETAADSSGNANTAFLYNCPTWRPTGGQVGGAIEFDGVDDYLQTANNNGSTNLRLTNDYTLSVWVKADASQKTWAGIFTKCSADGLTNYWTLQFDSSSPQRLIVFHPGGSWYTGITLSEIAGAWHNIRIVRSGTAMRSYLDGVLKLSEAWNSGPGWGNGHLNIGADRTATSAYVFKGLIDELRIYDQAADVNSVYPPNPPIGYWQFESGNGTVNIIASPGKAAIIVWNNGTASQWGQAGSAFYRSIRRN